MKSFNKIQILGNVGLIEELKTANEKQYIRFTVAENYEGKKGNEKTEKTQWFNITAFNKLGEIIAKHCKKGDRILLDGRVHISSYQDESGKTKHGFSVIAEEITFL